MAGDAFEVVSDAPLDGTALLRGAPRDSGGLIRDAAALWSSLPVEVELLDPGDRDFLEMMLLLSDAARLWRLAKSSCVCSNWSCSVLTLRLNSAKLKWPRVEVLPPAPAVLLILLGVSVKA